MNLTKLKILGTAMCALSSGALADSVDTMHLTDEPGNWFKSERTGTPVTIINAGDRVDFKINECCTNTRHTVTVVIKPVGSNISLDQDKSQNGTLSGEFDRPGVYVIVCKVHPYMTAVVGVKDASGNLPDVTSASLPFIGHLGATSLPAATVLSVMTTIAPNDADKAAKWKVFAQNERIIPTFPGIGEIWVNSQFERVPGQTDDGGVAKPGTITVVDAATFAVEREINGLAANGRWNNPHNMWANFELDTIYNANWFGKWINRITRTSGQITDSIAVGEAPTHIVTIPTPNSSQFGVLTIPLSGDNDLVKVRDSGGLEIIGSTPTGDGHTHPHAHWLTCGRGDRAIVPNVFTGMGFGGSVSIMDTATGAVLREFKYDPNDPLWKALQMPIAAGECHVDGVHKAYIANAVTGMVTVMNVDAQVLTKNIGVTLTPDGDKNLGLLDTLQVPIQTPVSPDEKWVATAVLSLTTVARPGHGTADHVALIDTRTDEIVKYIPVPAGVHGVNWGAKLGGGYYAYVTCQHSNALIVIDPDPNGDGNASDGGVVGRIILSNNSSGAGVTDGMGGQGVKPIPMTHDGWIQPTVALAGTGRLSAEVESWVSKLTAEQRDPSSSHAHTVAPTSMNLEAGTVVGGNLASLSQWDDNRLRMHPASNASRLDYPLRLVLDGNVGTSTTEVGVRIEGQASSSNIRQRIEVWDYVANAWVAVDERGLGTVDGVVNLELPNPVRMVAANGAVRMRLSYRAAGPVFASPWQIRIDQAVWMSH
jgi:hypothetical protein